MTDEQIDAERAKFEATPLFAKFNDAARACAWEGWKVRAALAAPAAPQSVPGWMDYRSRVGSMIVDEHGERLRLREFTITDMRANEAFGMPEGEYDLYAYPKGEQPVSAAPQTTQLLTWSDIGDLQYAWDRLDRHGESVACRALRPILSRLEAAMPDEEDHAEAFAAALSEGTTQAAPGVKGGGNG